MGHGYRYTAVLRNPTCCSGAAIKPVCILDLKTGLRGLQSDWPNPLVQKPGLGRRHD